MKVLVPTETRDLTVAQILDLKLMAPTERLRALRERRAALVERADIKKEHTSMGPQSPLLAVYVEMQEADAAIARFEGSPDA